jgi:hypothetical protein
MREAGGGGRDVVEQKGLHGWVPTAVGIILAVSLALLVGAGVAASRGGGPAAHMPGGIERVWPTADSPRVHYLGPGAARAGELAGLNRPAASTPRSRMWRGATNPPAHHARHPYRIAAVAIAFCWLPDSALASICRLAALGSRTVGEVW